MFVCAWCTSWLQTAHCAVLSPHAAPPTNHAQGGDLRAALSADHDGSRVGWRAAGRRIALEITEGLAYLHARNVTHRDLKSKNVLLTADLHAKVADVGGAAMHSATFLSGALPPWVFMRREVECSLPPATDPACLLCSSSCCSGHLWLWRHAGLVRSF